MISAPGSRLPPITLEDLAALNREMAALARVGLPLEVGLRQVAQEFQGGAALLANRLAESLAAGHTFEQAIAAEGEHLPETYRAVITAGLRSGRLAAALEGYAESAARQATLHRLMGQAAVYPLIVIIVAWVMLVIVVAKVMPGYNALELGMRPWLAQLNLSGVTTAVLIVSVPAILITAAGVWWRQSALAAGGGGHARWLHWLPGARKMAQLSAYANFADLLGLLLQCQSPINEALPLAARASGAAALRAPADRLAERLADGHALHEETHDLRQFPPLVRTVLMGEPSEQRLVGGLRRAAEAYRERASGWLVDMAVVLPVTITLLLAVGVVGVYALAILQPYFSTLNEMTQ
jgi:general secretion pathway protein F